MSMSFLGQKPPKLEHFQIADHEKMASQRIISVLIKIIKVFHAELSLIESFSLVILNFQVGLQKKLCSRVTLKVVAGGVHSLILTEDHRVFTCGINEKVIRLLLIENNSFLTHLLILNYNSTLLNKSLTHLKDQK